MTSNERSLRHARSLGWTAQVVEKWNPHAKRRHDLFGFIDILALTDDGLLAIQACSAGTGPEHKRKIEAIDDARVWIELGLPLDLWTWRKLKVKRGGKAVRWAVKREGVTYDRFTKRLVWFDVDAEAARALEGG